MPIVLFLRFCRRQYLLYDTASHFWQFYVVRALRKVLETKSISKASDVYSYGIVVWEVLSRKIPWADQRLPRDIYLRVVIRGDRPAIPADAPADIAEMLLGCWAQAPEERPTFHALLGGGNTDRLPSNSS